MSSPFIVVKSPEKNLHCGAGGRGSCFLGARVIQRQVCAELQRRGAGEQCNFQSLEVLILTFPLPCT